MRAVSGLSAFAHSASACFDPAVNQRNLFDENYGLASTQALKNKVSRRRRDEVLDLTDARSLRQDIPEGGSKGVILPDIGATPRIVFEKYVDAIIDLLLRGQSPGIKEQVVDLYKKEEIVSRYSRAVSTAGTHTDVCARTALLRP